MQTELEEVRIDIKTLEHGKGLPIPAYQTGGSAGMDLYAAIEKNITIHTSEYTLIPTGISLAIPHGYEAQIRPRSGLAAKFALTVLNSPGTIDSDYRGEIKIIIINHGKNTYEIKRGERIAQAIFAPVTRVKVNIVSELSNTRRGAKGFGSTGTKN
tara:strand:- start:192 stop:659 length:468 start_codon:yes stop_codon:yes gene_type:complete